MQLTHDFSAILKQKLKLLFQRDTRRYEIVMKKIEKIAMADEYEIEHYKNLRFPQQNQKRVHIDKSFVLIFSYNKQKKFILFLDFDHHDNIYKNN